MGRSSLVAGIAVIGCVAAMASAEISDELTDAGWQELTFEDKAPNTYGLSDSGEIMIEGTGAVSVLWRPIVWTAATSSVLSWRWQVDAGPPPTDLSQKGGDDRPISLYVSFEFDPDRSSFWERSKRALVQPFVDDELPGRVLLYVWGGEQASDEWLDSPYFSGIGRMKILQAADSGFGTPFEQEVNLAADFREAFGEEPTAPYQLAISSDGDDTGSTIRATIAEIRLSEQTIP